MFTISTVSFVTHEKFPSILNTLIESQISMILSKNKKRIQTKTQCLHTLSNMCSAYQAYLPIIQSLALCTYILTQFDPLQ